MKRNLADSRARWQMRGSTGEVAFTLIELLVVIAVISILAALLLPSLARAKAQGKRIACANNQHQMGLAMQMYLADYRKYPFYVYYASGGPGGVGWTDLLEPYYPFHKPFYGGPFTNNTYQCPAFDYAHWNAVAGGVSTLGNSSYAYNRFGVDPDGGVPGGRSFLGLGNTTDPSLGAPIPAINESQVRVPSDMFAIADARVYRDLVNSTPYRGNSYMTCNDNPANPNPDELITPRHGAGYNILSCDGHVELLQRRFWLHPSQSAHRWNNDHEIHKEFWDTPSP